MSSSSRKPPLAPGADPQPARDESPDSSQRRRTAKIVHDERGTASVEWHDAPEGEERPVLEIAGTGVYAKLDPHAMKKVKTFDPYDLAGPAKRSSAKPKEPPPQKRDLKKLSAWIKLMREMEERKRRGED